MFFLIFFFSDWTRFETEVYRPLDVAEVVVTKDRIFYSNQDEATITILNAEGNPLKTFGGKGQGPGEIMLPLKLIVQNDVLYVVDPQAAQIHLFDIEGNYMERFPIPDLGHEMYKTVNGWTYGDWMFSRDPGKPIELTATDGKAQNGKVFHEFARGNAQTGMVIVDDGDGPPPKIPYNPARERVFGAASADGSKFYVSNHSGFNIMVFDMRTQKLDKTLSKDMPSIPFNEEWGSAQFEELKERNRQFGMRMEPKFPEFFPMIRNLRAMPNGDLVVETWTGRPELDRNFVVFDSDGNEKKVAFTNDHFIRYFGSIGDRAIVLTLNEDEESGFVCVPEVELDTYFKENPMNYDGPGRMIMITRGE